MMLSGCGFFYWRIAENALLLGKPDGQFCVRIATLSSYDSVTDLKLLVILRDGDQFQESSLGSCCGSREVLVM